MAIAIARPSPIDLIRSTSAVEKAAKTVTMTAAAPVIGPPDCWRPTGVT